MPTTKQYGEVGAANNLIGGIPEIFYFDFASKGRGQVLRLLWEDAGIAYKDTRFSFDEYPEFKKNKLAEMNPLDTIPVVLLDGKVLTQSYAILRHFARKLRAYDGRDDAEMYFVDLMCDAAIDWRTRFVDAFFSDKREETYGAHCKDTRPNFLKGLNAQLAGGANKPEVSAKGPFCLGETISYADLVLYQVCHDEQLTKKDYEGLNDYPELQKLCKAVEERENVKAFMESDRYLG